MHLTMENLLCENKINLFQSVYYGLILSTQYDVTCRVSLIVYTNNGGMNRHSSQKTIDRNILND